MASKSRNLAWVGSPCSRTADSGSSCGNKGASSRRTGPELLANRRQVRGGEVIADRLQERQIGQRQVGLRTAAPEDGHADLQRPALDLGREAGLAEAGLTGQQDDLAVAAVGAEERVLERVELRFAPDENGTEGPLHSE